MRQRPRNPDAVDLAMQGWASLNSGFNKSNYDAAIDYFERALQLYSNLRGRKSVWRGDLSIEYSSLEAGIK